MVDGSVACSVALSVFAWVESMVSTRAVLMAATKDYLLVESWDLHLVVKLAALWGPLLVAVMVAYLVGLSVSRRAFLKVDLTVVLKVALMVDVMVCSKVA